MKGLKKISYKGKKVAVSNRTVDHINTNFLLSQLSKITPTIQSNQNIFHICILVLWF